MYRKKSFQNNQPLLYLVATPIGNLKEMSSRALEVLSDMDVIAAEDTRNTYSLLQHYGIKKELFSLREHNENEASEHLINLLKNGKKIAYVSDAGYPGISDPGNILVKRAIKEDIAVSVISGSTASLTALVASGMDTNHFYFYGFLPVKEGEANKELEKIRNIEDTIIFYEAPHRIIKTLKLLGKALGNRSVCICRELTKINEEYIRGKLSEIDELEESSLKGEMVIVVEGNKLETTIDEDKIIQRIDYFLTKGLSKKDTIEIVSDEFKINKNQIYKLAHINEK